MEHDVFHSRREQKACSLRSENWPFSASDFLSHFIENLPSLYFHSPLSHADSPWSKKAQPDNLFYSNCHLNDCNKRIKDFFAIHLSSVDPWLCARGVADVFPIATSGSLAACFAHCADH